MLIRRIFNQSLPEVYIDDFEATKLILEALKTAGDSWDHPLQDPKTWSTFIDF